ncbi:amino acid permease-domain-containing protein [Fomes fomentarius]|nr:amino acid permease-domain-containing protein [Fomes fomentarius]
MCRATRVVFAFARDNALPGSRWWKKVHPYTRTPVNAVWLVVVQLVLSAVCGLLGDCPFCVRRSICLVGMYTSYITPIVLRLTSGRDKLHLGPFSLGRWYMPIGLIAVAWVSFVIVLLMFPPTNRPTAETMNHAVVLIVGVLVFASLSWIFSTRRWFKGPVRTIDDAQVGSSEEGDEKEMETHVDEREMADESR